MKKNFVTIILDTGNNNRNLSITADKNTSNARSK